MPLSDLDLSFYDSLPKHLRDEWLFERTACDASLFYFILQIGGFSIKAGGDSSVVIHKPICDFWQDNSVTRKAVFMPRAWLKSTDLTKWGNLHRYLQNNEARILIPSQKIDLPISFIKFIKKQAVVNERLKYLYPVLHKITKAWRHSNSWGSAECEFPRKGIYSEPTFRAIGITGGAQGGHYDFISPDDLVSEKGMESKLILADAQRWFDNIEELLDNKKDGVVSLCGTHWGPGDLGNYVQTEYKEYKWLIVPALKDSNIKDKENIHYHQDPNADNGESNWPEMWPTKDYRDMQNNPQKAQVFWSQHMNLPEGADVMTKFSKSWLKYYRWVERDGSRFLHCNDDHEEFRLGSFPTYGIIDPGGFSEKMLSKGASRTAVLVGGQPSGTHKKFVTHAWAGRFKEPTKFLDQIFKAYAEVKPLLFRQEIFGQQRYILEDIKKEAKLRGIPLRVIPLESDERKDAKDANIQALIQPIFNGEVFVHESMKDLISEIGDYPGGFTVDLLDCLAKLHQTYMKRGTKGEFVEQRTTREAYSTSLNKTTNRTGY